MSEEQQLLGLWHSDRGWLYLEHNKVWNTQDPALAMAQLDIVKKLWYGTEDAEIWQIRDIREWAATQEGADEVICGS